MKPIIVKNLNKRVNERLKHKWEKNLKSENKDKLTGRWPTCLNIKCFFLWSFFSFSLPLPLPLSLLPFLTLSFHFLLSLYLSLIQFVNLPPSLSLPVRVCVWVCVFNFQYPPPLPLYLSLPAFQSMSHPIYSNAISSHTMYYLIVLC